MITLQIKGMNMKKSTLYLSLSVSIITIITAVVLVQLYQVKPTNETSQFETMPYFVDENPSNVQKQMLRFGQGNYKISDYVELPDQHVLIGGQNLTEDGLYYPFFEKLNLGGGAAYTSSFPIAYPSDATYNPEASLPNGIQHIVYGDEDHIYMIGQVVASLTKSDNTLVPLSGSFANGNMYMNQSILTFIVRLNLNFSQIQFLGYLEDITNEMVTRTTINAVKLLDENTMVIAGKTTSKSGVFEQANLQDEGFVIQLDLSENQIALEKDYFFVSSAAYEIEGMNVADNQDVFVVGSYTKNDGNFISLPLPSENHQHGFILRLNQSNYEPAWWYGSHQEDMEDQLDGRYISVMQLENNHLVAVGNTNLSDAPTNGEGSIIKTTLTLDGKIINQRLLSSPEPFVIKAWIKSSQGYFAIGQTYDTSIDITLLHYNHRMNLIHAETIQGSGNDLITTKVSVMYTGAAYFFTRTQSSDLNFATTGLTNIETTQSISVF